MVYTTIDSKVLIGTYIHRVLIIDGTYTPKSTVTAELTDEIFLRHATICNHYKAVCTEPISFAISSEEDPLYQP